MTGSNITKAAFRWTTPGKIPRDRPKQPGAEPVPLKQNLKKQLNFVWGEAEPEAKIRAE